MKTPEDSGDYEDSTLYIFIDESGNFDFSERGTRHFVMAGVATLRPMESAAHLHSLRYRLLNHGHDISDFHASMDSQYVRNRVFQTFSRIEGIHAETIFATKNLLPENLRSSNALHARFGEILVDRILKSFPSNAYKSLVIIFDQAIPKSSHGPFHNSVKPILKELDKPFQLFSQSMNRDMNGQIADYVAWSNYVALERSEYRPWNSLKESLNPTAVGYPRGGKSKD